MALNDATPRTAVNQAPGGGTDYPFYPAAAPPALGGVVLDAYVAYADRGLRLPFSLVVSGAGPDYDVTVLDAGGDAVVAGNTAAAVTSAWGDRAVHQWVVNGVVLRVVVAALAAGSGVLDPRTCDLLPLRVTSFRVGDVALAGDLVVAAGYNVTAAGGPPEAGRTPGGRYASVVSLDAVPGAGLGRVAGCPDEYPVLRRFNRVGPDCAGNLTVDADDCFRVQVPADVTGPPDGPRTATATPATLRLTSDCDPCCACEDYVNTYKGLKRVWDEWAAAAAAAEAVRDTHGYNKARWVAAAECRAANPAALVATQGYACRSFFGGSYCNGTTCCVGPVELRFTFERFLHGAPVAWAGGSVVEATISGSQTGGREEPYSPAVAGPVVRFFFDYADPGAACVAKFRFCATGCVEGETIRVTLTAHAAQPVANPHTGDDCGLPAATVSEDLGDMWAAAAVANDPPARAVLTRAVPLTPLQAAFDCEC